MGNQRYREKLTNTYWHQKIKHIQDEGKGKPAALNLALEKAKGEIVILTDGDVFMSHGAIKEVLKPFTDPTVGLVSGHPISIEEKSNLFGFWSYVLTDIGHRLRLRSRFIVGSGYLFAFRKSLIKHIPENALAEDAIISHWVFEEGFRTVYAQEAKVFVKYPNNFKDWIKQKKRSAGGYLQLKEFTRGKERMRSFSKESGGIGLVVKYCRSFKKVVWIFLLIAARLYLWFIIFIDLKLKRKSFKEVWLRVESTK